MKWVNPTCMKSSLLNYFLRSKTSCHNGPSLANMEFHALRMNDLNPTCMKSSLLNYFLRSKMPFRKIEWVFRSKIGL